MEKVQGYIDGRRQRFVDDLCEWLRMASVSTDPKFKPEVERAADWLLRRFQDLGLTCEKIATSGHPLIYAETPPVPGAPVVLVYGHYDVQPPDPLNEWETPPFEPSIRNGNVYARGATDDKGQMITHVFSAEAWIKSGKPLPVQLKFLIEGEEECGGLGLSEFLNGKLDNGFRALDRIKADIAVISDCAQYGPGQPAITYGLRGIMYFELRLSGPAQDLHSGNFGGAVMNPAIALCQMLGGMIDARGRIQVAGMYDDVIDLSENERQQFASLHFDEAEMMRQLGVPALFGETGYSALERRWARPTFDINGIWGGYQGEGAKTVLPARAAAKFSCRLVPNQAPEKIAAAVRKHLERACPPGIKMELIELHGAPGSMVPLDSPFMTAAAQAIEKGFGKAPVFIRSGGSIPVVGDFAKHLGIGTLLLGWGQDDDNLHSPNEKFSLADFHRGIVTSAHLWEELGKVEI